MNLIMVKTATLILRLMTNFLKRANDFLQTLLKFYACDCVYITRFAQVLNLKSNFEGSNFFQMTTYYSTYMFMIIMTLKMVIFYSFSHKVFQCNFLLYLNICPIWLEFEMDGPRNK